MSLNTLDSTSIIERKISPAKHTKIYSRYWRKNISNHEATEMAAVLAAMRKVASHIGNNVKPLYWRGMYCPSDDAIFLDPDGIKGIYPVPYRKIDLLVGQVVRDSFLCLEWNEWVKEEVKKRSSSMDRELDKYLDYLLVAAEEIYIDELVRSGVWSLYLSKYFKFQARTKGKRDPSLPPVPSSLASIWRKTVFLQFLPDNLHHYYDDLMGILLDSTVAIKGVKLLPTVVKRREHRVDIYLEMWNSVCQVISQWERFESPADGVSIQDESGQKVRLEEPRDDAEDDPSSEEESSDSSKELKQELAEEISSMLDEGKKDLTKSIGAVLQDHDAKPMTTVFSQGVAECIANVDHSQVKRLKKIFEKHEVMIKKSRKRRVKRGLDMGDMDVRRLYRVPFCENIFKRKEIRQDDLSWNIAIVADASASMGRRIGISRTFASSWLMAEQTFVSLAEAAKGFSNHLEVYGYFELNGQCEVVKLFHKSKLFTLYPVGQTPSGQAIMTVAMIIKKTRSNKKLIIHITDGETNCGLDVAYAIEYCQNNRIDLITIGCGYNKKTQNILKEQYTTGLYLMDNIDRLPEGLEFLFREKLLKYDNQCFDTRLRRIADGEMDLR
ncbi:MAG: vWA domain-containing protein [Thermodesulfobacteriota bacterium]|nr:vWA domain-containing protein [Thermodesulfobacteriota bacterium]